VSRAAYVQVVGLEPKGLRRPSPIIPGLPSNLDESLAIGLEESSNVVSALFREQAARFAVQRTRGELNPRVDLEANYSQSYSTTQFIDEQETASVTGRLTIPFYQGGEVRARVRQAKHTHVSRLQQVEQARNETTAEVTSAWSRLVAARAQIQSDNIAANAARTALDGVREEERVGQRTLLDVLDAEQEVLETEVIRVSTRRDLVVASFALLSAIGRLEAEQISVVDLVYEPEVNYEQVRNDWWSTTITTREPPRPPASTEIGLTRVARPVDDDHMSNDFADSPLSLKDTMTDTRYVEVEAPLSEADAGVAIGLRGSAQPRFPMTHGFKSLHPEAVIEDFLRRTLR
ncbi:MAG: TolC family protein, partial [Pseudomonadota bacterium]